MKNDITPWEPSNELKAELVARALEWVERNHYKVPKPSGPEIREIHVPVTLIPLKGTVDTLVFDAATRKLKAIIFDYFNLREVVVKRIDL